MQSHARERSSPSRPCPVPRRYREIVKTTAPDDRVSVVIVTYNRINELLRTLRHLRALPERPAIVVVDNASLDHTSILVRRDFPDVTVIRLKRNLGAAGRNIGVQQVQSRYVAFCDDDNWWAPGALTQAAERGKGLFLPAQ